MKTFFAVLTALTLLVVGSAALSFHDGGVAHCNGCHTMHNSQDGALVDPANPNGNPFLLNMADPSSVCIECHDHLDRTFPIGGDPLTPPPPRAGGNFIFLIEDNLNDGHGGATNPIPGDAAGHNIVATEYGLSADATLATSPGGAFPSSVMACTSCHDPHGNGEFRFLYGTGRVIASGGFTYTDPAPIADGLPIFTPVGPAGHTAYQSGMSAWCGNCHGEFHRNNTKLIHRSGWALGGTISQTYNLYNGTDDVLGGTAASSFIEEVPFEDPSNTVTGFEGTRGASQVSCISCHRAHATSAPDAGRWDFSITFMEEDGLESGSYKIPNPYGVNQRSLCNKCHRKDQFDKPFLVVGVPGPVPPERPEKEIYFQD